MSTPPLVVALGDLLLDVSCRPTGPLAADTDTPSANTLDAGGQAANVAAWAVAGGARGRLVARRARDPAGRLAERLVAARLVEVVGPVGEEAGGCVVVIVAPDGARTMVTDRGAAPLLAASDVDGRWLEGAAWLHVTGYALAAEPMYGAATAAADAIRTRGGRVSVDLASRALVDAMGAAVVRERVAALRPALVLGTEPELESVADRALAPLVVVKRGADGAALVGSANASLPAEPARVLDTTGAGDALAGGLLAAMAAGADPVAALRTGLRQAARCVERAGAMPARGRRV